MRRSGDRSATSKWGARAAANPFAFAASGDVESVGKAAEDSRELSVGRSTHGKENRFAHPNVSMRRGSDRSGSALGKRPASYERDPLSKTLGFDDEDDEDAAQSGRELRGVVTRALQAEDETEEHDPALATLVVDDFSRVGKLCFGAVPVGERKSLQLTLVNPSDLGNARVKYEGYSLVRSVNSHASVSQNKARFKCDLHVCVVDAEKSVKLRVTFEPLAEDVHRHVAALLKFTVNDRFKLQCQATGSGTPRVFKFAKFKRQRRSLETSPAANEPFVTVVSAVERRNQRPDTTAALTTARHTAFTIPLAASSSEREPEQEREPAAKPPRVGEKRRKSLAIEFSPPKNHSAVKKRRMSAPRSSSLKLKLLTPRKSTGGREQETGSVPLSSAKKPFTGSWWKQRQETFDENWMNKQAQGFTKWINYVLMDGTSQRLDSDDTEASSQGPLEDTRKRRFDFSSLRELAQKRMESGWAQAAVELYHSSDMDDVLFKLQEEINDKKLLFRADRPVYADVGLQEELLGLLNNYHPVWLCLGLRAVLGHQVMKHEKCSLGSIFSATMGRKVVKRQPKKDSKQPKEQKMPRALRRIILKHLVKDSRIARNFRLVKNLKTPIDGSTADSHDGGNAFKSTKKRVNGREYFDSLTQTFMLKFFMLVLFLDRAIELKTDKFAHFPCLFRIAPSSVGTNGKRNKANDETEEELQVKNSQTFVTEFCRFFLASEGRIDKHLKQLGYVLKHQQTPLDEIDLEVKDVTADLRDGVRLAKLMEVLTASPPASSSGDGAVVPQSKGLASFLRVPALSRLQKVHNVEICLHFLQDKCGADVLASIKSSGGAVDSKPPRDRRLSGRVRVSSSGFAGLRSKVDEKMVENLAKDIVSGHREKTLALLWKLISSFQLQSLVDASTMRREIDTVISRMSYRAKDFFDLQQKEAPIAHADEHESYALLLEWCRAVCANYSIGVNDFTTSFADGKALCYLLHYYHPMLLAKAEVLPTTNAPRDGDGRVLDEATLLANERRHFALVNERIKQLGEIPVLMPQQYHTKNPPEDKMIVTFVCYLQSRLMDSYSEIHAASRLKRWWLSPAIRLKMRRKKNKNARAIQRFWYTSSQKRLAIRQCRKLLRAARLVKTSVQTWTARTRFCRLKKAVLAIQRAFRTQRQQRLILDTRSQGAARAIQRHWRALMNWRREMEKQAQQEIQRRIARRQRLKTSCEVIASCWRQYACRKQARHVRRQLVGARLEAASRIQVAWRQAVVRGTARETRKQVWVRLHSAARVIQRHYRAVQSRRQEKERAIALARFEELLQQKEHEKRELKLKKEHEKRELQLKHKVEARAAKCVQQHFRSFTARKRTTAATKLSSMFRGAVQKKVFQQERRCAVLIQRNVRIWRRRRQLAELMRFHDMLKVFWRMMENQEQRRKLRLQMLQSRVETRAACRIQLVFRRFRSQMHAVAAVVIQRVVRGFVRRKQYAAMRESALLLQRNVRIWRRQGQIEALLAFQSMLMRYKRMQERDREQRWRRLQDKVEYRAAYRIQMVYRFHVYHKRALAARLFQAAFRGFQTRKRYTQLSSGVLVAQRAIRSWLSRTKFRRALRVHRAALSIQKTVRGCWSRRQRFDFYALQKQLQRLRVLVACWRIEGWYNSRMTRYRRRRALEIRAKWTQFRTGLLRKRVADANVIAGCWRTFCLRRVIAARVSHKQRLNAAALSVQRWWLRLCCEWAERARLEEEKRMRELEELAARMAKARAKRVLSAWLRQEVIRPYRERNSHFVALRRLQAWWRGMLVRMHHSTPEVTQQRKKLAGMKLVQESKVTELAVAKSGPQRLRLKTAEEKQAEKAQPLTLGARLEQALHMLLHGKRLQDMLFASHTIEICTRYSRECCGKCVQLQISSTIYAAIRGLNRSRPHVELLHQLLLVLVNLTTYRRGTDQQTRRRSKSVRRRGALEDDEADARLQVDLRALETLVDLLHIHRDMHHVFLLSARVIKYYLQALRPQVRLDANVRESWREADKRLRGLQDLLARKLAMHTAMAPFRPTPPPTENVNSNLMNKVDPKVAVTVMGQIVRLLE